ncbi:MAG: hypothetical protein U1F98_05345 [Verrucomicrobiota bacterium]
MITLAWDCLMFQMATGESVPFTAEMISVELSGEQAGMFDPEFVKHATNAVFHYFKHELGRETITVGEFAGALERVLRGFDFAAAAPESESGPEPESRRVLESDLLRLARESGEGWELFFFGKLRDELRHQLEQAPAMVRFRGLRGCVKTLTGARRWCPRCRTLHSQIVDFLRNCLCAESGRRETALVVE